jgi:hypothetical protein
MEVEALDLEIDEPSSQPRKSKTRGMALAGVCLSIVAGLQLIPSADTPTVPEIVVDEPTDTTVQAVVISSQFQWVQVRGLDRFESITEPIPTPTGYISIANPWGASLAASVVVSKDGSRWNRWGTIHGIGGETQIDGLTEVDGRYIAIGFYTESMPRHEFALLPRIPALWTSEDAISWEMSPLAREGKPTVIVPYVEPSVVEIGAIPLEGRIEYFGSLDQTVAMVHTVTTPAVTLREPGMRGDPFAVRADTSTQSLLITQDQKVWLSEAIPFDRINFNGSIDGAFLIRARSEQEPDESSFWLVTP